jgi:hypothetical protein
LFVQVEPYVKDYFSDLEALTSHEENFIKRHALQKPAANYFALRRFLFTALQNFYDIDEKYMVPVLGKLSSNVKYLIEFYVRFTKQSKNIELIYYNSFLSRIPEYIKLEDERKVLILEKDKLETKMDFHSTTFKMIESQAKVKKLTEEDKERYRINKKFYADATHEFGIMRNRLQEVSDEIFEFNKRYKPEFSKLFSTYRATYLKKLLDSINIKSYYLDKMLWDIARYNKKIIDFLQSSNIDGFFDTKTFLKYYLNTIDLTHTRDREWHEILVDSMRLLD